jgi:hypothetical protein
MTLNHDSAREEVNRQEAEHIRQEDECTGCRDFAMCRARKFGKCPADGTWEPEKIDAAFEAILIDQEKARREVDEVDPHT